MRRIYRRKRPFEYLLPFLVIVGVGVIGVLGFQLWNNLQGAKGDVYFYIAEGKAKMLQYGLTQWESIYSGTKLSLGDSIKTEVNSRGVLKFFNGSVVRLDGDSSITITDITKRNDVEKIGLTLTHGNMWVNKVKSEGVDESDFLVRTTHMQISDTGTVFEVESNDSETVRVIQGAVTAKIFGSATDQSAPLDTVQVGVGQEMTLNQAILQSYQNHDTPSVLMALDDQFRQTDWYSWNSSEDATPTDYSLQVQGGSSQQNISIEPQTSGTQQNNVTSVAAGSTQQSTAAVPADMTLTTPQITQPDPPVMSTDLNKVAISGTVSAGTAKVVVHETVGGVSDDYTLSKYKAGSTTFAYNVSEALGNYKAGENDYSFYAVDAAGNKSGSAVVTITYNKAQTQTQQITDALTAPQVQTYNGVASNVVTTGVVKIIGSVTGAQTVVVNDYPLSKFVAGDKTWTYYANENGGNLVPGENTYHVYATDPSGNKSDVTTFTITYNKPAGSTQQPATSTSTTSASATSSATQQSAPDGF